MVYDYVALFFSGNVIGEYHSFGEIGIASLEMIANQQNIALTSEEARAAVLTPFRDLAPHKDVVEGLKKIRSAGLYHDHIDQLVRCRVLPLSLKTRIWHSIFDGFINSAKFRYL